MIALAAVPIAILANAARVAGTGLASELVSPAAAEGFFHTFSGWLVFVVALRGLVGVQRLIARRDPEAGRDSGCAASGGGSVMVSEPSVVVIAVPRCWSVYELAHSIRRS